MLGSCCRVGLGETRTATSRNKFSKSPMQPLKKYRPRRVFIFLVFLVLILCVWRMNPPTIWFPDYQGKSLDRSALIQRFPFKRTNLNRNLIVLLWTKQYHDPNWYAGDLSKAFTLCPVSDCVLTNNREDVVKADALLFHSADFWNYGHSEIPGYRRDNQVYVLQNMEAPTQHPITSAFNMFFNWTLTYRPDSDVYFPYGRFEKLPKRKPPLDVAASKSAGIAWVASNCADNVNRGAFVQEIQKYIKVDTYGICGNSTLTDINILRKYKFYLAFENSFCDDYITEKFYRALTHHSLPVVSGGGDYSKVAPPHSYIDVRDFGNVQQLVVYLKYLEADDTAYNSYFEWTRDYNVIRDYFSWCHLCKALHDETRPYQVYTDWKTFISHECQTMTKFTDLFQLFRRYSKGLWHS